jgi:uncharacterized membrane protein
MNPIKSTIKTEVVPVMLIILSILASFYFYAHFPDRVATHWNYNGQIDGWSGRGFAAFFFPMLNLGLYLLFLGLPYLDPKKDRYAQFAKPYHIFKTLIVGFLTVIYFLVGSAGIGYPVDISLIVPSGVGVLFIIIGNYLGKIKPNWFMGIRTPWTLSNEEVWNKTNRLGGKLFIIAGLIMLIGFLLPPSIFWVIFIIILAVIILLPIIYSYWLYQKIEKNKDKSNYNI